MILGFKPDFVPQIIAGTKVHTIRAGSRWANGQVIHFYTVTGQDNMTKFQPDGVVKSVQVIRVEVINDTALVEIDGRELLGSELAEFIRRDGFESLDLLLYFLDSYNGLPFIGQLIHWTDLRY
ncbi:MAG: hypothetical protein JWP58_1203 [Hymenobacter sp.]|nr:hypothetical protein [Hymenobacter sp.]